jgi:hypothetical protein
MAFAIRARLRPPFFVRKPAITTPSKKKRVAFTAADVFLRRNGFYIEVEGPDGYSFIYGSMDRHEFRFAQILDWIRQHIKPVV